MRLISQTTPEAGSETFIHGQFAGDGDGGADSKQFQAWPNPGNVIVGFLAVVPHYLFGLDIANSIRIHFASERTIKNGKENFFEWIDSRSQLCTKSLLVV